MFAMWRICLLIFREESLLLVEQNETLQNQIHEAEKETMSIVEFMRKTEEQKDQQVHLSHFLSDLSRNSVRG